MNKTKVTYILSNIDKSIAFEWIAEQINHQKFKLSFILLYDTEPYLFYWLKNKGIECYYLPHFGKKSYFNNFFKVVKLLKKIKPKVVHTHLLDANLIGLLAAKICRIKKRIYTRHHSTYHHQFFPKAVKWDKLSNKLSSHIIAISKNVETILLQQENVPANKISLIHHGFNLQKFDEVENEEINKLKNKYQISIENSPVIGVISRYINWKGIQYIIPAFKQLTLKYPQAKLILANANGPDKAHIHSLLKKELTPNQYLEIKFEPNLYALYQLFDVYVHVPINNHIEAFGQTYVEALAAGIPSVFTLSGVANEFIENNKNAIVVDYKNSNAITNAIAEILTQPTKRLNLINNGKNSLTTFSLNLFVQKLEHLYE